MTRIMLLGKDGQVGWELQRTLACLGEVHCLDYTELDLTDLEAISKKVESISPDVIVNAAAYTAVDKAENDQELANIINGEAVGVLAKEAAKHNAILIHYSTDYVFDGNGTAPYPVDYPTKPLSAYGVSKLLGEERIRASGAKYLIFRTSWVYTGRGKNFLLTMLDLARKKDTLSIIDDQRGAPTWSRMIAESTALALSQCLNNQEFAPWGTYHMTNGGETNWYEFAETIFEFCSAHYPEMKVPQIKAIPTSDYPTPAKRPSYSVLDNTTLNKTFGIVLPNWKEALHLCIQDMFHTVNPRYLP